MKFTQRSRGIVKAIAVVLSLAVPVMFAISAADARVGGGGSPRAAARVARERQHGPPGGLERPRGAPKRAHRPVQAGHVHGGAAHARRARRGSVACSGGA